MVYSIHVGGKRPRTRPRGPVQRLVLALALALLLGTLAPLPTPLSTTAIAAPAETVIYGDGLAGGWSNWSWSSSINFQHPVAYGGARAIWWRIDDAWGGLQLHTDQAVQTSGGTALRFALRASQGNQRLSVAVYGDGNRYLGGRGLGEVGGVPPANSWKVYDIPLSSLGAAGQRITGVLLQDAGGGAQPPIEVDEITLTGIDTGGGGGGGGFDCSTIPAYPEIRPGNTGFNQTPGRPTDPGKFHGAESWRPYYARVNGACTGTTEQILEWAAKKWGFDQLGYPDLTKAMAVVESWWRQTTMGPNGEVGILQVRDVWPDWEPARWSTAYSADYAMAVIRSHYDGNSWLGGQTRGDLRGSVAAWECGCPYNGGNWYANRVFGYYDSKPWKRPGVPPEWFYKPNHVAIRLDLSERG